jgi:uncharacterized protein YajQ (UPF0234 family)
VLDVLIAKLTKRSVDIRFLDRSAKIEKIGGDKVKQLLVVKSGIDSDTAKKIQTFVKQSKLKVQAAIQGDTVRVSGTKRDDLQQAIALMRKEAADAPLSFTNFRD